jgi:hypothetical protein
MMTKKTSRTSSQGHSYGEIPTWDTYEKPFIQGGDHDGNAREEEEEGGG